MFFLSLVRWEVFDGFIEISRKHVFDFLSSFELLRGDGRKFNPLAQQVMSDPIRVVVDSTTLYFNVFANLISILPGCKPLNHPVVMKAENLAPEAQLLGLLIDSQHLQDLCKNLVVILPERDPSDLKSLVLLLQVGQYHIGGFGGLCTFREYFCCLKILMVSSFLPLLTVELHET